jgi:hypothetical protein
MIQHQKKHRDISVKNIVEIQGIIFMLNHLNIFINKKTRTIKRVKKIKIYSNINNENIFPPSR